MPSRSETTNRFPTRAGLLLALLVLAVAVPSAAALADVISTGQFVILPAETQAEDAIVTASSGNVAGVVDGDLIIATSRLTISGTVTGDVFVVTQGPVTVTGTIEGSLRGAARSVVVSGRVGDDVLLAAVDVAIDGTVGRDVIVLANQLAFAGEAGRDVLGRVRTARIDGVVPRDVDMTVDRLIVGADARVGGDVLYKSTNPIRIESGGDIGGQVIDIPSQASFFVAVVARVLLLLGFFGFLVGGVVVLWVFRRTATAAMDAIVHRPWLTAGVGLGAVVLVPVLIGLLIATLVGIPLALLLLFFAILTVVFAAVPVVTVAGAWALRRRGRAVGGFLLGGTVWALLVTLLPVLGSLLAVVVITLGIGAWIVGAVAAGGERHWATLPVRPGS